ncbi:MAG: glycosyltransferase [Candidatus Promineofilum sp.]|nr:glycosyltransferase [Promineifilum sp.]
MSQTVLHQFLPGARSGDAITDQALMMRGWLRDMGYTSNIFAQHIDPDVEAEILPLSRHRRAPDETWAIYHHSIGSDVPAFLKSRKLQLILIYHNITPPEFFAGVDPLMAYQLRLGHAQLAELRPITSLALADSSFNAIDLRMAGYENRAVLPITLQPRRYDIAVNPDLAAKLATSGPNLLFIGRLAPNKAQADLVILLHFLRRIHPAGHLYLVGDRGGMGYDVWLEQLAQELGVAEHVTLTGKVSHEDMMTYLKGADLYVSMSEHEGFGVPLIESMYLGLPVMAYGAAAVPQTMGKAGLLFFDKNYERIAELAHLVLADDMLRRRMIDAQRLRVQAFLEPKVRLQFEAHLQRLDVPRPKKRIAVVVQRYGEEVNGGAEVLARLLAEHLLELGEVHVITTCAVDHHTWANSYPPGEDQLNGVTIHRFTVDAPRVPDFLQKTKALLENDAHTLFDEVQWIMDQGPYSDDLLNYLRDAYHFFDLFIFFTYLYAPTYFGLQLVSDKAVLVPTAHDEPYLHFPIFRPLFHLPQFLVYSTEPERELVNTVANNEHVRQIVAGMGINPPPDASAARFREKYGIDEPFLLYVGRIDQGKNVPGLIDDFTRFRDETGRPLKLVLLGRLNIDLPPRADVVSLGFVPEQDKYDAIEAAVALAMPSRYESLSIVLLEAWAQATAVLVNGWSDVLRDQIQRSNGGLAYTDYDEFAQAVGSLLDDDALRARLGRQGQAYVTDRYQWPGIIAQYRMIFDAVTGGRQQ